MDRRIYLETIPYYSRVAKKPLDFIFAVCRNHAYVKSVECFPEIALLPENCSPAESCLIYLQHEPLEKHIVILDRESIKIIVIDAVDIVLVET